MPSILAAASVSPTATVFPNSLSTSFTESQVYPLLTTPPYHDGTVERSLIVDGVNAARAAREWQISKRLTTAQLTTLRTFWRVTVQGGLRPFYFYPVMSQYDATGVSTTGRVTCFFRGAWSETILMGRHDVAVLTLVEVL